MIETKEVIEFFDRLASGWDAEMVRSDEIIRIILDNAGVTAGKNVLDVACGTGVLVPDYLKRGVASVTGIDISPKMVEIARSKFPQESVTILCGDVETAAFDRQFDCIVVYNAFPHFPDPERLIRTLAGLLTPGGALTVAHGMSREKIDAHHHGSASHVSNGLMPAEDLAAIFGTVLNVTVIRSDERMYQIVGRNTDCPSDPRP
jgi:demethylmenaquinone methyltransferase/2-methoxy-6-polyprenyl-1,4-benzoquinol methylase